MPTITDVAHFAREISAATSADTLRDTLAEHCDRFGFSYFALSHHVDFATKPNALRLHNYPAGWEDWYDANQLGLSDPIHRASHFSPHGFHWGDVPQIIPMSPSDHQLLGRGRRIGLGDGVTVPVHMPGEARGSCSFVAAAGRALPADALHWAQAIGAFAFAGARRLHRDRSLRRVPRLSERQRQCVALAGRGMSNPAIARHLGIGVQSVMEHLREARAKLGVSNRVQLVTTLLEAGWICFDDVRHGFR